MSTASQVLHLLRFALLRMRWWLAAYGAALLLSILAALRIAPVQGELATFAPFLLVMLGMLVAAISIQSNSPIRPEAFWRGQAVHAAHLLASKVVLILLLLIILPLVSTGVVVYSLDISLGDVVGMIRVAAPQLALWTTLAALSAASTRDSKSTVLLIIGGAIAAMILADNHDGLFRFGSHLQRIPWSWVFAASGVCLVSIYQRRLRSRAAIVTCLVIVTAGVTVILKGASGRTSLSRDEPVTSNESLEIDDVNFRGSARADGAPTLRVRVVGALPNVRYELRDAQLTAYFANRDSMNVSLNGTLGNGNVSDVIALPPGLRWRLARYPARSLEGTLSIPINGPQERRAVIQRLSTSERRIDTALGPVSREPVAGSRTLDDTVVRIRVQATLTRYVADEVVVGPFTPNIRMAAIGQRLLLREGVDSVGRSTVTAEWLAVGDASRYRTIGGDPHYSYPFVFVLQHAERGEAVMLKPRGRVGQENSFVVPGVDRRFYQFSFDGADAVDRSLDPAWLRKTTVRMLRWRAIAGVVQLTGEQTVP